MRIRTQILGALVNGPRSCAQLAQQLTITEPQLRSGLSNARTAGEVDGLSSSKGQSGSAARREYQLTDAGRKALAGERENARQVNPLRVKQKPVPVPFTALHPRALAAKARRLARYARDHEQHVALQRKLGIAEALIGAASPAEMPGAGEAA